MVTHNNNRSFYLLAFVLLCAVVLTYSNHFDNAFHFDDSHTITNNMYIRDVGNVPKFFTDANTRSSLPTNQAYRPVLTTTVAIDYWLSERFGFTTNDGEVTNRFFFHLSTFIWFLIQGVLMFFLFFKIMEKSWANKWNKWFALLAVGLFMLHPANAETINYIIARSDSLSTLAVVLGLYLYSIGGIARKYFLFLLPVLVGILIKPTALMFAPILMLYILFFEEQKEHLFQTQRSTWLKALKYGLPSLLLGAGLFLFSMKMTPKTWQPGGYSTFEYAITQPWVLLRYIRQFIYPDQLSADTDWRVLTNISDYRFIVGVLGCLTLLSVALFTSLRRQFRPIAFGIFWFFLALLPSSSVVPLAEVTNDHRMFFPFVGLVLVVAWGLALLFYSQKITAYTVNRRLAIGFLIAVIFSACVYGTYQRNKVWRTGERLWYDVTVKSPTNGRGLMNYGLALMRNGDYENALRYYNEALAYTPNYPYLHINLGVVNQSVGNMQKAEFHYKKAIELNAELPEAQYYYGAYLLAQQKYLDAKYHLKQTLALSPAHRDARKLLMSAYATGKEYSELKQLANETLSIFPDHELAQQMLVVADSKVNSSPDIKSFLKGNPTADQIIEFSLTLYNLGDYKGCVDAAEASLKLNANNPYAYNNICSAYNKLKEWDKAIAACDKAITLKPDFQLAKNNKAWAESQK